MKYIKRATNYIILKIKELSREDMEDTLKRWRQKGAKIGKNIFIGGIGDIKIEVEFAHFLEIEDNVTIAKGTQILLHDSSLNNLFGVPLKFGKVIIRKNAYIGANCTLLCGVEIGEGALIGAGSLVTADIPAGVVAYGVPAKVSCTTKELLERYQKEMSKKGKFYYWDIIPWREHIKNMTPEEIDESYMNFLKENNIIKDED